MRIYRLLIAFAAGLLSCNLNPFDNGGDSPVERDWQCVITEAETPDYSKAIGCQEDFTALASVPLDASIPGARSVKTVIDLADGGTLYFQNSDKYKVHWDFASAHLSGGGRPVVPTQFQFNQTEYYSPHRRFVSGAVTYYDGPDVWVYEIAPYDKAGAEMIGDAFKKIVDSTFFGSRLFFHPSSQTVKKTADKLPNWIKIISTGKLFEGIDYQPLNFAVSYGRLVFITAKNLASQYLGFRDIVVLDAVPNDISVTSGIITQEFQTPLSHINVLSQNRGTPNMALRGAFKDKALRALEGKWVKLDVGSFEYEIKEAGKKAADEWWEKNRPADVSIPQMDLETKELKDIGKLLDLKKYELGEALKKAISAYGGKASHFGAFPHMDGGKVNFPQAFAVPVFYYWKFMEQNGFDERIKNLLTDDKFQGDPSVRDERLKELRSAIKNAPVDSDFETMLIKKLKSDFPGVRMRFRSSTNAEDLDGFTGAGLYTSKSGSLEDPGKPVLDAVRKVWASVWYFRAFEERSYRNIDHQAVGMALLVHRSFPDEEANGVAITANPFDPLELEPGFYINVQKGGESVVQPDAGVTSDQLLYHMDYPGQPVVYMAHSSLVTENGTVLSKTQIHKLGVALKEIHSFFRPLYGSEPGKWWAMDTEFKFDQPLGADASDSPVLFMKQARPYPGFQ